MNIEDILKKIQPIKEQHVALGDTDIPIEVSAYATIASKKTGLEIKYKSCSWSWDSIKGSLLRYEDRAVISYSHKLNPCWTRFVITKELCHLMFDDEASFTGDVEKLVSDLVLCNLVKDAESVDEAGLSEYVMIIAALELLVPINLRREAYDWFMEGSHTTYQIAHIFRVPERYIQLAFSDAYRNNVDTLHYQLLNHEE